MDEAFCLESFSLDQSQYIFVDAVSDGNISSCVELATVATQSIHIHVPINGRPVNMVRVKGLRLLCHGGAYMSVLTAGIFRNRLYNVNRCISIVASDDDQYATCMFRCSSGRETEYIVVGIIPDSGEFPIICEIYVYWM